MVNVVQTFQGRIYKVIAEGVKIPSSSTIFEVSTYHQMQAYLFHRNHSSKHAPSCDGTGSGL
jgi:hypothetical protein